MFFKLAFCLAFLTGTTFAYQLRNRRNAYTEVIINDEADNAVAQLNGYIIAIGEDTSSVGDLSSGFEVNLGSLVLPGYMALTNGKIRGKATLKRVNDCTLEKAADGYNIVLALTFRDLSFSYSYKLHFLGVVESGNKLDGFIKNSVHTLRIKVQVSGQKTVAKLQEHIHSNEGDLQVKLIGSKFPDVVVNHLENLLVGYIKPQSSRYIFNWLGNGIRNILSNL